MDQPAWFQQIKWTGRLHIAALNGDRRQIPDFPGCYVFVVGGVAVAPGRVLYVGEATRSLRQRMGNYLVDYRVPKRREGHKGKGFVLEARHHFGDRGVFASWVEYGGSAADIHTLEASLIHYLNPAANDRDEEQRHGMLGDWESLDPRLIR